jgi:hypothetical protein
MLTRRSALVFLVTAAAGASVSGHAQGSIARALSLQQLARQSESVVVGTPLAASSRWEQIGGRRRIVTYTRVRVDQAWAGGAGDSEIMVRTLGGRVGKIGQVVHGEAFLRIGASTVLFVGLAPDGTPAVAGMSQGHYPIRSDASGVRRLGPSPRLFELSGSDSAVERLSGRSLAEARELVRKAWDAR